jgi:hypothetical protein
LSHCSARSTSCVDGIGAADLTLRLTMPVDRLADRRRLCRRRARLDHDRVRAGAEPERRRTPDCPSVDERLSEKTTSADVGGGASAKWTFLS